jgi:hypothetical protein
VTQDVSKLVDICRQSIVFESVDGIIKCLALITQDKDVEILRIKNKLDPAYNSAQSAGYRDVALNIRVATPEAKALGANAHVCELQLVLRQYAELKVNRAFNFFVVPRLVSILVLVLITPALRSVSCRLVQLHFWP